jgi:hypothetical protein
LYWVDVLAFDEEHPADTMVSKLSKILQMRYTLMPTLRMLRRVLKIVDMLLDVQWLLKPGSGTLNFNLEGTRLVDFVLAPFVPELEEMQTTT